MLKNACKHHSNFQVFQTQDKIQSDSIILNSVKTKDDWMLKVLYILIPVFFEGTTTKHFPFTRLWHQILKILKLKLGVFFLRRSDPTSSFNPFWGFVLNEFLQILQRLKPCNLSNPRLSLLQRCVGQSGNGRKLATHALLRSGGAKDRESKPCTMKKPSLFRVFFGDYSIRPVMWGS